MVISVQVTTGLTLVISVLDPSVWSLGLDLQTTGKHHTSISCLTNICTISLKFFKFLFNKFIYLFILNLKSVQKGASKNNIKKLFLLCTSLVISEITDHCFDEQ